MSNSILQQERAAGSGFERRVTVRTPGRTRSGLADSVVRVAWLGLFAIPLLVGASAGFAQTRPEGEAKALPAAIVPSAPVSGYRLAWSDEFEGDALDRSKWDFRTDSKHLSTQRPENVSVKNGKNAYETI